MFIQGFPFTDLLEISEDPWIYIYEIYIYIICIYIYIHTHIPHPGCNRHHPDDITFLVGGILIDLKFVTVTRESFQYGICEGTSLNHPMFSRKSFSRVGGGGYTTEN